MAVILKYENGKMVPVHVESVTGYVPSTKKGKSKITSRGIASILIMLFVALNIVSVIAVTID